MRRFEPGTRVLLGLSPVLAGCGGPPVGRDAAATAPRVHHQSLPDEIVYQPGGLFPGTISRLQAMGHTLVERTVYSAEIAAIGRGGNGWIGVADRAGGSARAY
ncbi:MAG: gamma-glutamyltransferase [Gemmatimonadetes bacterium]|nr:gamma-glutamyltransferase [Gemmatimonadota bacterium]